MYIDKNKYYLHSGIGDPANSSLAFIGTILINLCHIGNPTFFSCGLSVDTEGSTLLDLCDRTRTCISKLISRCAQLQAVKLVSQLTYF